MTASRIPPYLTILVLIAGCSAEGPQSAESFETGSHRQPITNRSDEPSREITIATDAHAKCTLYSDSTGESMPAWADDVGLVHLWPEQAESPKSFLLECDESGGTAEYPFDVSDAKAFLPAIPRVVPTGRRELPALSDDPMSLSQAELLEAGYPPRPDPAAAPELYAKWLEVVSEPMTFVEPHLVERTDLHFGPITTGASLNWAGSVLQGNSPAYFWALGTIPVPTFSNPPGLTSSRIAPWVGLDGWGAQSGHVVQDGLFYDNVGGIGTYYAFHEYYPDTAVLNSSMTVSAGHTMTFWAWAAANSSCNQMGSGYGCFWYKNESTGVTAGTLFVAKPPLAASFAGATAEAIYERVGTAVSKFSGSPGITFAAFDINSQLTGQMNDPYLVLRLVNTNTPSQTLVQPFTTGQFGQPETNTVYFLWQQAQ